jgi:molybdopterin-guanine dinucleotide biosynthesis protein
LPELKKLDLRVGVLKHHAHATGFDVPGKDEPLFKVRASALASASTWRPWLGRLDKQKGNPLEF